jgi:hypothetical protein
MEFDDDEEEEEDDEQQQNALKVKGMLVDLLERKVSHKEAAPNGIVGREIRISDRGLEIIENENNNSREEEEVGGGETQSSEEEPQKMTFYASPEVIYNIYFFAYII